MTSRLWAALVLLTILFTILDSVYLGRTNILDTDLLRQFNQAGDVYRAQGNVFQEFFAGFQAVDPVCGR